MSTFCWSCSLSFQVKDIPQAVQMSFWSGMIY